eukprot:gene7357-biopygen7546
MPPLGDHGTSGVQRIASACSKVLPRRRESSSLLAPMGDEHLLFQPRLCSDTRERAVGEAAQLARGQHPQHTSKSSSAPAAPVAKGPLHPWLRSFLSRCAGSVLFGGFSLPPVGPVLAFWRLWFRNRCGRCVCRGLEMPFYVDRLVRRFCVHLFQLSSDAPRTLFCFSLPRSVLSWRKMSVGPASRWITPAAGAVGLFPRLPGSQRLVGELRLPLLGGEIPVQQRGGVNVATTAAVPVGSSSSPDRLVLPGIQFRAGTSVLVQFMFSRPIAFPDSRGGGSEFNIVFFSS